MTRLASALLALLLAPSTARAGSDSGDHTFWSAQEEASSYDEQLALGDELAFAAQCDARDLTQRTQCKQFALRAIEAYEKALAARPESVDPHRRIFLLLRDILLEPPPGGAPTDVPRRYLLQAIEHIDAIEAKAPLDPLLSHYYFSRATQHTKLAERANLLAAVRDYDKVLQLADLTSSQGRSESVNVLGNQAEVFMMLGDLDRAITGYEAAVEAGLSVTIGYGLAVALDRDHQGTRAREVAQTYARGDSKNELHGDGTFFVPAAEVFYYDAIRYEGLGQWSLAIAAYQRFIRELPNSPWVERAKENIAALKGKKNEVQPEKVYDFGNTSFFGLP